MIRKPKLPINLKMFKTTKEDLITRKPKMTCKTCLKLPEITGKPELSRKLKISQNYLIAR